MSLIGVTAVATESERLNEFETRGQVVVTPSSVCHLKNHPVNTNCLCRLQNFCY